MNRYLLLTASFSFLWTADFVQASSSSSSSSSFALTDVEGASAPAAPIPHHYNSVFEPLYARDYLPTNPQTLATLGSKKDPLEKSEYAAQMGNIPAMVKAGHLLLKSKSLDAMRYMVWAFQESLIAGKDLPDTFKSLFDALKGRETIGSYKRSRNKAVPFTLDDTFYVITSQKLTPEMKDKVLLNFCYGYSPVKDRNFEPYLSADEKNYKFQSFLKIVNPKVAHETGLKYIANASPKRYPDGRVELFWGAQGHFYRTLLKEVESRDKNTFSQLQLARALDDRGAKDDAMAYWKLAADAGDPTGQFKYAFALLAQEKFDEAAHYSLLSAKQGSPNGQLFWTRLFLEDYDIPNMNGTSYGAEDKENFERARQYLLTATQEQRWADQKDYIHHNLACIMRNGIGGPQDLEGARHHFKIAADSGFAYSQYNLAVMLDMGLGGEQDVKEAFRYFEAANKNGINLSKIFLAQMLYDGEGCTANPARAAALLKELLADNTIAPFLRSMALAEQARQKEAWDEVHVKLSDAVLLGDGEELQKQIDILSNSLAQEQISPDDHSSDDDVDSDQDVINASEDEGHDLAQQIGTTLQNVIAPQEEASFVSSSSSHETMTSSSAHEDRSVVWQTRTKEQKKADQSKRRVRAFVEERKAASRQPSGRSIRQVSDLRFQFHNDHEKQAFYATLKGDDQNGRALNKILTDMVENTFASGTAQAHSVGTQRGQKGSVARNINQEDRFVYKVLGAGEILVLGFDGHYKRQPVMNGSADRVSGSMSEALGDGLSQ